MIDLKNKYSIEFRSILGFICIYDIVGKALSCGDISKGFREYMCFKCGISHKVGFMCKGKFCNKCCMLYAF